MSRWNPRNVTGYSRPRRAEPVSPRMREILAMGVAEDDLLDIMRSERALPSDRLAAKREIDRRHGVSA